MVAINAYISYSQYSGCGRIGDGHSALAEAFGICRYFVPAAWALAPGRAVNVQSYRKQIGYVGQAPARRVLDMRTPNSVCHELDSGYHISQLYSK